MRHLSQSTLLRFFVPLFVIVVIGIVSALLVTTQRAKKTLYQLKAQESLAVLQNVMEIVAEYQRSIDSFRKEALQSRKEELNDIVNVALSVVEYYYEKSLSGVLSEEDAKKEAIKVLSRMRYRKNDYIWGINENYELFLHPDASLLYKSLYNLRDPDGVYVIRELVDRARLAGNRSPVYVFYRWWRYIDGEKTSPQPKLSVAVYFEPWGWIVGTGVYINDIDELVVKKRMEAQERLRERLSQLRLGTGYPFVFDENGNIIYHPVLTGVNIIERKLKDPATGRLMYDELKEAASKPWGKNYLEYLWDRPTDRGNYIYPKVAWCAQEPLTGWYIVVSAYKDEIEAPMRQLAKGLLFPSVVMVVVLFFALLFVLMRLLFPVRKMVEVCKRIERGDLSARAPEVSGEIGYLAKEFNKMIEAVRSSKEMLEEKVRERTKELLAKTKELEEANRRLKELDQAKSAFLSSVSHELRTPLTSILGFAKLIEKDFKKFFAPMAEDSSKLKKKADRIVENLEVIIKEGERLTRLINDVLDLTKIESGRIQWKDSLFPLKELLEDVLKSVSGQFAQKEKVELKWDLPDDLPKIYADRDRMHQVFINLLNNAAKFTEEGYVKLWARRTNGKVLIAVEDTGCGIPPEEKDKVFDKFHQVVHGDTLKDKPKGTGLGLSICKQIVEHYNGRIWVESELGKGSTFFVELPLKEEWEKEVSEKGSRAEPEKQADSRERNRPLILVVDDEESVRKLLSQIFTEEGFQVETAGDGVEAVEKAKRLKPDLITMDIMMPKLDGQSAIKLIKEDEELSQIPILVISVLPVRDSAGGDAYLEKPIDEVQLLELVRSLIEERRHSSEKPCLVVREDKKETGDGLPVILCPGNVIYCTKKELQKYLEEGFTGTVLIPSSLCQDIDIQGLSEREGVQVVVF